MKFELPLWLQRWLDVQAKGDERVYGVLHFPGSIGATWTLLLVLAGVAATSFCYFRSHEASRKYRAALAAVRLAAIVLLLAMIGELRLSKENVESQTVVVLVDDSRSMNLKDRFADPAVAGRYAERVREFQGVAAGASVDPQAPDISRLDLAKTLLLERDAAFLRAIVDKKYQLRVYRLAGDLEAVPARNVESYGDELSRLGLPVETSTDASQATAAAPPLDRRDTTRLGDGLEQAKELTNGINVAAVIIVSDGVNREGRGLPPASPQGVPLYAVGIGETMQIADLQLSEIKARESVMVNDLVTFECVLTISAQNAAKPVRQATLTLREAGAAALLETKIVEIKNKPSGEPGTTAVVRFTHRPTTTGVKRYAIEAKPLENEVDVQNNVRQIEVAVRSDRVNVLLVSSYPGFEHRYLKQMLARDETIRLSCVLQEADFDYRLTDASTSSIFPISLEPYDVIILGDVDPSFLGPSAVASLRSFVETQGRGLVLCSGPRFLPLAYRDTDLAELMPIDWDRTTQPGENETLKRGLTARLTTEAVEHPIFQLAENGSLSRRAWADLPPLYWTLRTSARRTAQVMVDAVDAGSGEAVPLIVYQRAGAGMVLFHCTDETWRWRWRVGDLYFARYWVQAIRQLAASQAVGRPVVLEIAQDDYETEAEIRVEVNFNDERLIPTDGEITVQLYRLPEPRPGETAKPAEADAEPYRPLTLTPGVAARKQFEATIRGLPAGAYIAKLDESELPNPIRRPPADAASPPSAEAEGRRLEPKLKDSFRVKERPGESTPAPADHQSLRAAAGPDRFFTFADAEELLRRLPSGAAKPTTELKKVADLWNHWLVLLVFLALLVGEWVLRKRRAMV